MHSHVIVSIPTALCVTPLEKAQGYSHLPVHNNIIPGWFGVIYVIIIS